MSNNINISRKKAFCCYHFKKLFFSPISPKIEKNYVLFKKILNKSFFVHTFFFEVNLKNRCFAQISENINIKNKGKGPFLEISLKKQFFVHMSNNINIARKITLFWDHFEKFVQHFQKKERFFDITLKNRFFPYLRKSRKTTFF